MPWTVQHRLLSSALLAAHSERALAPKVRNFPRPSEGHAVVTRTLESASNLAIKAGTGAATITHSRCAICWPSCCPKLLPEIAARN